MSLIAAPPSQFSDRYKNGSEACTGIATVFAITVKPENIDYTDFEKITETGIFLWSQWYNTKKAEAEAKALESAAGDDDDPFFNEPSVVIVPSRYCESYELIKDLPFLRDLLENNKLTYDIVSGFIVPGMEGTHENMIYIGQALEQNLSPGCTAVLTENTGVPSSFGICRHQDGNRYYIFDSHPSKFAMSGPSCGRVLLFESLGELMEWLNGPDKFSLAELASNMTPSEATAFGWENLRKFMYSLTIFNIYVPSATAFLPSDSLFGIADRATTTPGTAGGEGLGYNERFAVQDGGRYGSSGGSSCGSAIYAPRMHVPDDDTVIFSIRPRPHRFDATAGGGGPNSRRTTTIRFALE
jgi:hypothetical protein